MRKFIVRFMAIVLSLSAAFSALACGGNAPTPPDSGEPSITYTGNETVISTMNFGGGVGRKWLDNAARRFERANVETEFESGKKGVKVEVTSSISTGSNSMSTLGYNIFFDQLTGGVRTMIQQGLFMNINDIVTEDLEVLDGETVSIEDKILVDERYEFKGADGNYYALPHYEFYDGATYDVDLFINNNLYLADSSAEGVKHTCRLLQKDFYFVKNAESKKSCGNDGEYGTYDDGLPTTLEELIAMCDYMKIKKQITPFVVAGNHVDYSSYFVYGLWTALSGYEASKAKFTFDGTVETVTGFSNENLFSGVTYVKKPNTEVVEITEETGYKAINDVNKYYAEAFMQIAVKENWIDDSYAEPTFLHTDAMRNLILNGIGDYSDEVGMIFEGSYWLNEAEDNNIFYEYKILNNDMNAEKKLAWFNLPTSLNVPVTEGNGREEVLASGVKTYAFINNNLSTKPGMSGVLKASKEFLKFLYTDAELKNFVKQAGTTKMSIDVDIDDSIINELNGGQKSVMQVRADNRVVSQLGDNATLKSSGNKLAYGIDVGFRPHISGTNYTDVVRAVSAGRTAQEIFNATSISAEEWLSTFYRG